MPNDLSMMTTLAMTMAMVLLLPRLMERFRIPGVLGFILAGVVLGPGLMGVLNEEGQAIHLLSELGKLLFMFFVGFEIDLEQFRKTRARAAIFGVLTFLVPFILGVLFARVAGYEWTAAVLIGSVIASHTLLAYPLLSKLKLNDRESVLATVGATIFTDIAAMLVLALAVSTHQSGFSWSFLAVEMIELAVFVPLVLFGLSKLTRKAIIRYGQTPEARVMILLVVIAVAAELADLIHLEGIVGAFLVGIAVKRAVRGKFAVEQLEVLAHSMFIPAFFLTTGFLVDFSLLGKTLVSRPGIVLGLIGALVLGKFLAAGLSAKFFHYSRADAGLMFSLTLPQMAATLASAVIGHQALNSAGEPLLDMEFVNAVLVMVFLTCVAGPMLSAHWAKRLPLNTVRDDQAPTPVLSQPESE